MVKIEFKLIGCICRLKKVDINTLEGLFKQGLMHIKRSMKNKNQQQTWNYKIIANATLYV